MLTVILTGGQSRRMGRDKALLPVGNETMSLKLAKCYACLGPVAFSVDRPGRFDCGGYLEIPSWLAPCITGWGNTMRASSGVLTGGSSRCSVCSTGAVCRR